VTDDDEASKATASAEKKAAAGEHQTLGDLKK